jgi:transcriptional/translational regulatory protein YebC/TACO1
LGPQPFAAMLHVRRCAYHTATRGGHRPRAYAARVTGSSRWANIRRRARVRAARRAERAGGAAQAHGKGLQRVRFEGYGPGGAKLIVDCLTGDRNRLGAAVRRVFLQHGGQLGAAGSVSYLFNCVGLLAYPPGTDAPRLTRLALEAGAEDVVVNRDASVEVLTDPPEFAMVRALLTARGFAPAMAEVTWRAAGALELSGEAASEMVQLLEALEALDEVCEVYSDAEIQATDLPQERPEEPPDQK